jgi:GTP-binding protein LepA
VRLNWKDHVISLIDTPSHVDFGYEVSRSLAACEGVILLAMSQGIRAQTLANCYLAMDTITRRHSSEQDRPAAADPDRVSGRSSGCWDRGGGRAAHLGEVRRGVPELLDPARADPATGRPGRAAPALIFDSYYTPTGCRALRVRRTMSRGGCGSSGQLGLRREEIGVRLPVPTPVASLGPGEVGYLIAGIKDVGEARVGETVTTNARPGDVLTGYRHPKPMVFCGLYPVEGDEYADLREALEKLRLNDSSFTYEPETSGAGFGSLRLPRPPHGDRGDG